MPSITIAVAWDRIPKRVHLEVQHGRLVRTQRRGNCVVAQISGAKVLPGAFATLVTVRTSEHTFTFFLRDVNGQHPILIPTYGVAVTTAPRNPRHAPKYRDILDAVTRRGLLSGLAQIQAEPEESFETAAARTRQMHCETWLGLSRDIRIFSVSAPWHEDRERYTYGIRPLRHSKTRPLPTDKSLIHECFVALGRGCGAVRDISRWLDGGDLPILHMRMRDGELTYDTTALVTLERSPLTAKSVRGTHYAVAHGHGAGCMFTPSQQQEYDALLEREATNRGEQTVLLMRTEAVNTGASPRYAFLRAPSLNYPLREYDRKTGVCWMKGVGAYAVCTLNGRPMPQPEIAALLQPGEKLVYDIAFPHDFLPRQRVASLRKLQFEERLEECRAFWRTKLRSGASIRVPEQRIDQMIRTGLLHLDLVAYGQEPNGPVAPSVGVYSPIGSESAPIIQFFDSMGWHALARRAIQFFLERQHDDGLIQNFGGYMLETGPVLWTAGEHFRYTRDVRWAKRVMPRLLKSCEYLLAWRQRNRKPELRGRGYGLIEGKVADPNDPFRQFMLNGYAYLGLKRVAEILSVLDPSRARRLAREAEAWKRDIRTAYATAVGESPVIPLRDGTWAPTAPPWAESRGFCALYVKDEPVWTHGTFVGRDSMIGPLYLLVGEVLDPHEPLAEFLLHAHHELFTHHNAAFSQPYYTRHDWAHVVRGEVKPFLKTYYNQLASLADRETYTFWEHYYMVSPHKTHEEAWFLMQTRWMLWLERGRELRLLSAVPRAWLEDGKSIELDNVATHFGPMSLSVRSSLSRGAVEADVTLDPKRRPARLVLRLPHPQGRQAIACNGGRYDPAAEAVVIDRPKASTRVALRF